MRYKALKLFSRHRRWTEKALGKGSTEMSALERKKCPGNDHKLTLFGLLKSPKNP
jgi:hypothetical protein